MPQQYMQDVMAKGQLLDIIKLVGKDEILKSLDPKNPPKSIPAAKAPEPNLRGPVQITQTVAGPAPNDPRDPEFKKDGSKEAAAIPAQKPKQAMLSQQRNRPRNQQRNQQRNESRIG